MTYSDVRSFSIDLYNKLHETFLPNSNPRQLNRQQVDDEDMALIMERLLVSIQTAHTKSSTGIKGALPHRVIVIDEVDCF